MVITQNKHLPLQQNDPYGKLVHLGIQIGKDLTERLNFYLDEYGFYAQGERCLQWLLQHPLTSLCLFLSLLACGIPIILFATFAVTSIFMTFTGFLLIEGTILSVATLFLLGIFVTLCSVVLSLGAFVTSIYLAYSYIAKNI